MLELDLKNICGHVEKEVLRNSWRFLKEIFEIYLKYRFCERRKRGILNEKKKRKTKIYLHPLSNSESKSIARVQGFNKERVLSFFNLLLKFYLEEKYKRI